MDNKRIRKLKDQVGLLVLMSAFVFSTAAITG